MFETLQEKTEEKAMVQFLERFTDYPFLVKFKNSEYHIGEGFGPERGILGTVLPAVTDFKGACR